MTDHNHWNTDKHPIQTRLRDIASQENNDGMEYDLMVEAADHIRTLEAFRDEVMGLLRKWHQRKRDEGWVYDQIHCANELQSILAKHFPNEDKTSG